jgi:TolB-like protein/DNA-binding winged helix-turn-helix (wHTH) protein/Tfp pilus assembly protein PilF
MDNRAQSLVRFGSFELDQRTCELRKHGLKIKLQQRPYQVLNILLERRGDVVSREELQRRLWPDGVFVDFDHGLNTAIKKLRDALGDTAASPRYIATVDRHGYRFAADVQEVVFREVGEDSERAATSAAVEAPLPPRTTKPTFKRQRWLWLAAAMVLLILADSYIGWRYFHRARTSGSRTMLAVLPFENLTGDSSQEYFSDGLTEELITQLGQIDPQSLGVIARTSVARYKKGSDLGQVARELGVNYVLEGSVRRDSEKVRIDAQLIQIKDQTHVWARQYDHDLRNLLSLQSEIAQEVADEIELTLGKIPGRATPERKPTGSPASYEAYDLYLKGRYFWNKRSPYFRQAADYFQQAIDKDPNYSRAYAGLADTYALMSTWDEVPPNEFMPKARTAALKALQLDENLAEAHTSLALIAERYDYDWQTAEKEFRRSIQLDPAYATAHQWYAECLSYQGRFDESLAESERARQLDPLSLIIATDHGAILYFSRQYDRAIEQFRAVLEMEPTFYRAYMVVSAEVQAGRFEDALADLDRWPRNGLSEQALWAMQAYVYGRWGKQDQARTLLAKLQRSAPPARADISWLPAYLGAGQNDEVIALLQKAYADHGNVVGLKVEPIYDPLRNDPRFQDLLRHVGLAQ